MPSKDKIIRQSGFQTTWKRQKTKSTDLDNGFHCMRDWQIDAFEKLKNKSHMIINAPMGSGKSWMMCLISTYKLNQNNNLRCIICVPQTIIAPGFTNEKLQLPDGLKIHWQPTHNLCNSDNKSTVDYVIKWLKQNPNSFNDRILLCTHATIVAAFKKLEQENRLDLLLNLLCWIDEAHHVKNCLIKGSNAIGTMVSYFINNTSNRIEIGMTTATFFRGDRSSLLFPDQEKYFTTYPLPYDEYLKSMDHLESFSFDFVLCGQAYTKAIEMLIKNHKAKDIIYIPHPMSRNSSGKKLEEVQNIIEIYKKKHGGEIIESPNGLTIIKNDTSEFKILDLVNEDRRKEKKTFLESKQLKNDRDHLDSIIALGMFKEGANWIWAERSIIVGSRGSLVEVLQMIGRVLRDAEDKKHVEIILLLPFSLDQKQENFKENLNNYIKVLYSLLLLEDIFNPVKILIPKNPSEKTDLKKDDETKKIHNRINELFPDETSRISIINKASDHLLNMSDNNENINSLALKEKFLDSLPEVLKDHVSNSNDIENVGKYAWSLHSRRTFKLMGIDVENIKLDLINKTHPLGGMLRYTSGACGIDTFTQLRKAIQSASSPLSKQLIIGWIQQHIVKYDKKPGKHTGVNEFADGEHKGITWAAIDIALRKGLRTLPGGSCLVKINEELGHRSFHKPPPFSKQQVLDWIIKYKEKNDKYPTQTDGIIEFAEGEYEGETWSSVDSALRKERRGFSGGSSLATLVTEEFNIKNHMKLPNLTTTLIIEWATQYFSIHDKKPTRYSGIIEFVSKEYEGITWAIVNKALEHGVRGFPGGSSLAKLIQKKLNIKNHMDLPKLTEEMIVKWISQYIEKHKEKPTKDRGIIEFASGTYKGITWGAVISALTKGGRGLPKGSSLATLIQGKLNIKNHMNLPKLTEEIIIEWAKLHLNKYKKKPSQNSGEIEFASEDYKPITWLAINTALDKGGRGLPGGSSLALLVEKYLGIKRRTRKKKYNKLYLENE